MCVFCLWTRSAASRKLTTKPCTQTRQSLRISSPCRTEFGGGGGGICGWWVVAQRSHVRSLSFVFVFSRVVRPTVVSSPPHSVRRDGCSRTSSQPAQNPRTHEARRATKSATRAPMTHTHRYTHIHTHIHTRSDCVLFKIHARAPATSQRNIYRVIIGNTCGVFF